METENLILHQKEVAKEVLSKLKQLDIYATLAGGACRDWVLGVEASDLDFYMYYNPLYPSSSKRFMLSNLLGVSLTDISEVARSTNDHYEGLDEAERGEFDKFLASSCGLRYTSDKTITNVFEVLVSGVSCQIVLKNELIHPDSLVRGFCFDICQTYMSDTGEIKTTKAFDEAIKHKVIRITGEFYSQKDTYIGKIKNKFPDYLHIGF